MCTTYPFLSLRFGTNFTPLLFFILPAKNGSSLWFSCSCFGYSTSTSKRYPLLPFLTISSIQVFCLLQIKTYVLVGFELLPIHKGCFHPSNWRYMLFSLELYRSFMHLLLALAKRLTAWVISPWIPFSTINSMSLSISSSSLNSLGHTSQSLVCNFLGTYSEMF